MSVAASARKTLIKNWADSVAGERDDWIRRNAFFYADDQAYMQFLVRPGLTVLEIGCGTGDLLNALKPSFGVGVDFSAKMLEVARGKYKDLHFIEGDAEDAQCIASLPGPFEVIVISDTIGLLDDCQQVIKSLHAVSTPDTRIVISYYNRLWEPVIKAGERLGSKMRQDSHNWLSTDDIKNLLHLCDFQFVKSEWRQILPKRWLGLGAFLNRYVGTLPLIRKLCVRTYVVARPIMANPGPEPSVTVLIPCRNERGNIENAVRRLPQFGRELEILFVEGHSSDGTLDEIKRVIAAYADRNIRVLVQTGKGKGDAVRTGFANAKGDVLMILDADLTVMPEALPRFFQALVSGKGEFVNGTRLVYPLEDKAMRFLNLWANRAFSDVFSWLLNQRFTDTLCGTKVLSRKHYEEIASGRSYFGDFDPFGDFDLILGASKLNLQIVEIPVRYQAREYGETQISRFRHGWMLLRMTLFAYQKLKAL
jgi:SAM-dependent methyltransferase